MFIGLVVELTIEIVVGILFTGGTLTIEAILAKLGEAFKAIAGLFTGIVKGLYKTGEKTLTSLIKGLEWLYEFLNKGTDEILRIVEELFEKVSKTTNDFIKKYVDDVANLSESEIDWMVSRKTGNLGGNILNPNSALDFAMKLICAIQ